ncbi:MAG TPA: hypothetical protein VFS09_04665 [Candidatus Eisenbacteria bacterium]|nr:hypothetical protein [Candidatus Eisenbacteria bacterium]
MRTDRARGCGVSRRALLLAAALAATVPGFTAFAAGDPSAPASPAADSSRALPAQPADSSGAAAAQRADSSGAAADSSLVRRAEPEPPPRDPRGDIETDQLRFDGRGTPARQFEGRWPAMAAELPFAGTAYAIPVTLDAGVPLAGWRSHATDRTVVSGFPIYFGAPNAATSFGSPGYGENDPFLVTTWRAAAPRPPMEGPAELLARPRASLWWEPALGERKSGDGVMSSALLYEKGAFGLEQAGARFTAPSFGPGVAGAYTWRTSDGEGSFLRASDARYSVAIDLPGWVGLTGRVRGDLAYRRVENGRPDPDPAVGRVLAGEALLDDRRVALDLERRSAAWEHVFTGEVARASHTSIDVDSARERWNEPSWTAGATSTWRPAAGWSWIATARATGRSFQARVGPATTSSGTIDTEFATTRAEGRAGLAVRRESVRDGSSRSWSADVAYDARDKDRGFLDARLGVAMASPRGIVQLDLESSHERATWEDRLFPSRDRYFFDDFVIPKPVRYSVHADPDLVPRQLNGASARAVWRAGSGVEFGATGSARHVADDFGWELSRVESADSIVVTDMAIGRGSGWVSHASLSFASTWRSLSLRAFGWLRGGSSRLSPHAGSPPRTGAEATLEAKRSFFQGDLPLRLGVDAHVAGERTGPIRDASRATLDASLCADFVNAGLYLRVDDLLDRRGPTGAYEIATDGGVPSLGRRFRFGVVWNLMD